MRKEFGASDLAGLIEISKSGQSDYDGWGKLKNYDDIYCWHFDVEVGAHISSGFIEIVSEEELKNSYIKKSDAGMGFFRITKHGKDMMHWSNL